MADRLEIGRFGKAHGLRGEVAVTASTNRAERFEPGSVLYAGERVLTVAAARLHGDRWIVRFEEISDRTAAEELRGTTLTGDPLDTLADDELWVHELVGCEVVDADGVVRGTVVAVQANPAHDLLELDGGTLIPMVFVVAVEPGLPGTRGRIVVNVPDGLFELG